MSTLEGFISSGIKTYKHDKEMNYFKVIKENNSDSDIIKDMVSIISFLEENDILYTVEANLCIRLYSMEEKNIVVELDENGKIILFNGYAVYVTGYQADEVLHRSWFDIFIPEDEKDKISDVHQSVLEGESLSWYCTNDIICKDKTRKTVNWTNFLIRSDNESQEKVFSIGQVEIKASN